MENRSALLKSQKREIKEALEPWMQSTAQKLIAVESDMDRVDETLALAIHEQAKCKLLYILDVEGSQRSSNITQTSVDPSARNQGLADRPYFTGNLPWRGITLSPVYAGKRDRELTITAMHAISDGERLLGFLAADFLLDELDLISARLIRQDSAWKQFRGDRAIRSTLFMQERIASLLDQHHNEVNATLTSLMIKRGVFHVLLHFSSARAIIWLLDDPYRYQLLNPEELTNPDTVLLFPKRDYSEQAVVQAEDIPVILDRFKKLRNADENIYLRSGSLNVINGIVGLTFSCDGSHYMSAQEFLKRDMSFWYGNSGQ
jgi:hypothetical protein